MTSRGDQRLGQELSPLADPAGRKGVELGVLRIMDIGPRINSHRVIAASRSGREGQEVDWSLSAVGPHPHSHTFCRAGKHPDAGARPEYTIADPELLLEETICAS